MNPRLLVVDSANPHLIIQGVVSEVTRPAQLPLDSCQDTDCDKFLSDANRWAILLVNTSRTDVLELAAKLFSNGNESYVILSEPMTTGRFWRV